MLETAKKLKPRAVTLAQRLGETDASFHEDTFYGAYYRRIKEINPVTQRVNHKLVCKLCDKVSTSRISDIHEHIRNHLKVKPYKCHICGLAFSKKSNRTRHLGKSNCLRRVHNNF